MSIVRSRNKIQTEILSKVHATGSQGKHFESCEFGTAKHAQPGSTGAPRGDTATAECSTQGLERRGLTRLARPKVLRGQNSSGAYSGSHFANYVGHERLGAVRTWHPRGQAHSAPKTLGRPCRASESSWFGPLRVGAAFKLS